MEHYQRGRSAQTASQSVIVFLRAPDSGRVKTRLARFLGNDAAADLYRCFVSDLLSMLKRTGHPVRIAYTPPDAGDRIAAWLGSGYFLAPQKGADLGRRMADAFRRAFAGGVDRALLVGTDLPDLPQKRIADGFAALQTAPAVLTPTPDGGYCLIGFRADAFAEGVFDDQPWGTGGVLSGTLAAFRRLKMAPRLLDSWPDIDTAEDISSFMERIRKRPQAAPKSAAFLAARFK